MRVPCHELLKAGTDPMDLAIEVGAEDVVADSSESDLGDDVSTPSESNQESEESEGSGACFQFKCEPKDLKSVSDAIREQSFSISSASLEYVPKTLVELEKEKYDKAVRLLELLSVQDDVIEVYDNFTLKGKN